MNSNWNRNLSNSNANGRIAQLLAILIMKSRNNFYEKIASYNNLNLAYEKARINKSKKDYVIDFEKNLNINIKYLRTELLLNYRYSL